MVWVMAHGDEGSSQRPGMIPPLFRAMAQDDESVAQMVALLEEQDAMLPARRLRDWAIEKAAVQPGDHVVDLGSGTGTMSRELARMVALVTPAEGPRGWVTGIEPNARLRAVAVSSDEGSWRIQCFSCRGIRWGAALRQLKHRSRLV